MGPCRRNRTGSTPAKTAPGGPSGTRTTSSPCAWTGAAPQHVHNVRRHFIDLFTPAELDTYAALNERVLRHLGEESSPGESTPDDPALPA